MGDAALATKMAERLLQKGVYVVGFSYPVVPEGKARIRVQLSAAHNPSDLAFAVAQFAAVRMELKETLRFRKKTCDRLAAKRLVL